MIYGKTDKQRAMEHIKWREKFYDTRYKWFAWYPVKLDKCGRKVWWQTIYRKRERWTISLGWHWVYKLNDD